MEKFEKLFAEYPCTLTDELVKKNAAEILEKHKEENNTREVWMQCLHQIDLTTLNGEDTTMKVANMAQKVNDFDGHFPGVPNVAAMCVYPALVETAREVLTEPIGIAAVAGGFPFPLSPGAAEKRPSGGRAGNPQSLCPGAQPL